MDLWEKLKNENDPILLYGMGDGAEKVLSVLETYKINISGIFVSDEFLRDKIFHGFKLLSYSQAKEKFGRFITLVSFGTFRNEVIANIKMIASEQKLYIPDVPVMGSTLFNDEFIKNNIEKLIAVYNKLESGRDKYIYESLIRYKITGNPRYLERSEIDKMDAYKLLNLKEGAVCADCGAYTGDTVLELLEYSPKCGEIFAFEPDRKTFGKLIANTEPYTRITCVNAAVSNNSLGVRFSSIGSRGSKCADDGVLVPSISVDEYFENKKLDFLKLDVEGMEASALDGAYKTIKQQKPKMLISCYHRSEDVFELPLKVLEIRKDYKVHIIRPRYYPAWDTAFIFV